MVRVYLAGGVGRPKQCRRECRCHAIVHGSICSQQADSLSVQFRSPTSPRRLVRTFAGFAAVVPSLRVRSFPLLYFLLFSPPPSCCSSNSPFCAPFEIQFRLWVERNPIVTQFLQSVFPYDEHREWGDDRKHLPFIHNREVSLSLTVAAVCYCCCCCCCFL